MIVLPFPPALLSGHANGNQRWEKIRATAEQRAGAKAATLAAGERVGGVGDILLRVTFYPPDRRGDRISFPNRMKAAYDGVADALGVNDVRFVPEYYFRPPEKPGRVEIEIVELSGAD